MSPAHPPDDKMHGVQINLDPAASDPPFEQVRSQLAAQISDERLPAGTRLPPVRKLAADLGLAANTVARVYKELEAAGLVETHGRGGTTVSSAGDPARERVRVAAQEYAALVTSLGMSAEQGLAHIGAAFGQPLPP
jgi:DNA-binding transcriptional regulator YhcF (GntR family)